MLGVVGWKVWRVSNFAQQHATTCNRVCKGTQPVTSNNVGSCWSTMLRPFARSLTMNSFTTYACSCRICLLEFQLFLSLKTMKNSSEQMWQLQAYVANESTLSFKTIVIRLQWIWNPSVSFVICFCEPDGAQRSIALLAFWFYWPIKSSR